MCGRISKKEEDELVGAEARCLLANETKKSPSWFVLVVGGYVIGIFVNVSSSRRRKRTGTFAFPTVVQ